MFSCECWGILKKSYFEEHLQMTASVDNFKMFHSQCFDFMTNTVCIMYNIDRAFQETHTITLVRAHTRPKVFRRVIYRTRK